MLNSGDLYESKEWFYLALGYTTVETNCGKVVYITSFSCCSNMSKEVRESVIES